MLSSALSSLPYPSALVYAGKLLWTNDDTVDWERECEDMPHSMEDWVKQTYRETSQHYTKENSGESRVLADMLEKEIYTV